MAITLAFESAEILYTGALLRVAWGFTASGGNPMPSEFRCPVARSMPTFTRGGTQKHLIYDSAAWEINRASPGTAKLVAFYRLHPGDRIVKGDTTALVVTLAAGAVKDITGDAQTAAVTSQSVTNNSGVTAAGFADQDSNGFISGTDKKSMSTSTVTTPIADSAKTLRKRRWPRPCWCSRRSPRTQGGTNCSSSVGKLMALSTS